VIVVIGQPVLTFVDGNPVATGSAARIALAAADRGAAVQLIGKVGEDPDGEALVLALAQGHVGHVAVLRDAAHRTPMLAAETESGPEQVADVDEPMTSGEAQLVPATHGDRPALDAGDVELGLRYLTEFRVVVVADGLDQAALRVAADAAGWNDGTLVTLVPDGEREPAGLPPDVIVLGAPPTDPDGVFDRLVGQLAAAIDAGADPHAAFREAVEGTGWEPAEA
jgi:hypothetical protein